jgi:hypothetical protein
MSTVYQKSPKGDLEIRTRTHRLPPYLRQALILIDGKRNEETLRQLLGERTIECLLELMADEFIVAIEADLATRSPVGELLRA